MPSKLKGYWTINKLLNVTYQTHTNRFEYAARDVTKSLIRIKKITVYDGKHPGDSRTRFDIMSYSYPQYAPYFTKYDSKGRLRTYQRTYRHQYQVIIQLDTLTINNSVKIRTGSDRKYDFKPNPNLIKSKTNPYGKYLSIGDYNIEVNGINPDFFFTNSFIRHEEGCLFGRNYANGFPAKANPLGLPFLCKHEIVVVETLMERGKLTK